MKLFRHCRERGANVKCGSLVVRREPPASIDLAVLAVFVIGVSLRVLLAIVNADANDAHLPVIRIIAFENRFPEKSEVWEAFQPKLYHATVAVIWKLWPTTSMWVLTRLAQAVSCTAGIATLVVVLVFLRRLSLSPRVRFLVFALVALNPELIGISAQATNDAFVILFGTLVLYFGFLFFQDGKRNAFVALIVAACLAGLSKGNGLVAITAVLTTFVVAALWHSPTYRLTRGQLALHAMIFAAVVLPIVWEIGPYGMHQRQYGSAFVTNWPSSYVRPGFTSVAQGLLTFRLLDLIQHPFNTHGMTLYPAHRTSLWSRLYGQAHFVHFEQWPRSWQSRDPALQDLGRLLLVVGLLPSVLLGWQLWATGVTAARWLLRKRRDGTVPFGPVLLVLAAFGHLAFVAVYAYLQPDFSTMKVIFIFPGLLGFVMLLASATEDFSGWCSQRPALEPLVHSVFAVLLLGYVIDVSALILQLS
jgi:Dolichyl-phosphate-mannose-protein mannosyltransferase